jgi:DNA-binding transcriptional LysR family regulator
MHTRHPFARRESLTRQDLKGENILFMSPSETGDSIGDAHYIDLYQKAGFQPNIIIRTNDYESILMMVAAEEGISIMPEYCIGQLRSVDNITYRPLAGEEETEEVLAVWHKENVTPALQHFIDEL